MSTSGDRVASRDMSEAASATTSTRPTKGRATSREATSSRTRRRSSYTQTVVAPLPGPRILSSIKGLLLAPPGARAAETEPTREHPAGSARVGAPPCRETPTSALVDALIRVSPPPGSGTTWFHHERHDRATTPALTP